MNVRTVGWTLALVAVLLLGVDLPPARQQVQAGAPADAPVRRVNVWKTPGGPVDDDTAAIFWFGHETDHNLYNYVDVRVGYTEQALRIFVTVVDYNLWERPSEEHDPRLYDAVAVYLDTQGHRSGPPQADDYFLANGWRSWPNGNTPSYHRAGRGNGSTWDESWSAAWVESVGANWYDTGPNNNGNCPAVRSDCDAGWATVITVTFSDLGLAGAPPAGTAFGLGVYLYDRDAAEPAGLVEPAAVWPEGFAAEDVGTWGKMVFDPPPYVPGPGLPEGTSVIRRGLGSSVVADAYVGGDGNCDGGYLGGGDINHGSEGLFVASQSLVADFPCWSKSYLRFGLEEIPPGKTILSATLTLHLWGNAGYTPSLSLPSYIHLFSVAEDWNELDPNGIVWNNAPLAWENLAATWVYARTDGGPDFPGVPTAWDATQAVAEAYGAGRPLNIVLYTADTHFDSSKYFVSSDESSDWIPEAKPTLRVVWGEPIPGAQKTVQPATARTGDVLTYTLRLVGAGTTLYLHDPIPPGTTYVPGSARGGASYDEGNHRIEWNGALSASAVLSFTFGVTVTANGPQTIVNTATITDGLHLPLSVSAVSIVNGFYRYLPLLLRGR